MCEYSLRHTPFGEMRNENHPSIRAAIIIVLYNGRSYLDGCLEALLREAIDCEVILVDNASEDGGSEYAHQKWPSITIVANPTNVGFAAACNQGAQMTTAKYLVFLNQDTRVCEGWLNALLDALEQSATIGLATSKLIFMRYPEQINACGLDVHFSGITFQRGAYRSVSSYNDKAIVCAVMGAAFALRRTLWVSLGGFDQILGMYYEETDLSWRAQLMGYMCICVPQSIVQHDQTLVPSSLALYNSAKNRTVLLVKNWRLSTLVLLFPTLLLAEWIECLYFMTFGWRGFLAKVRAWQWLMANGQLIAGSRRNSQKKRTTPDWVLLERCLVELRPSRSPSCLFVRAVLRVANMVMRINFGLALHMAKKLSI